MSLSPLPLPVCRHHHHHCLHIATIVACMLLLPTKQLGENKDKG
jgi:hypothetical protein